MAVMFAFSQLRIMIDFLRFLYSGRSDTKSKFQSFGETDHGLTCCSLSLVGLQRSSEWDKPVILCIFSTEGKDRVEPKKISIFY